MDKLFIRFVLVIRKVYWYIFRPKTFGTRIIMVNSNKILLVKHAYDDYWYLPGGGTKRGENDLDSIIREVMEEVGINMNNEKDKIKFLGKYFNEKEYKKDYINIYYLHINNIDFLYEKNLEIEKAKFFDLNDLPINISQGTYRRIYEYINKKVLLEINIW